MKRLSLYQTPAAAWASDAAAVTKESCFFKGLCVFVQGGKSISRPLAEATAKIPGFL